MSICHDYIFMNLYDWTLLPHVYVTTTINGSHTLDPKGLRNHTSCGPLACHSYVYFKHVLQRNVAVSAYKRDSIQQ